MPIVSASASSSSGHSASHWASAVTASAPTRPSNGQPKATAIVAVTRSPAARATGAIADHCRTRPATDVPWFRAQKLSVTGTTTLISSTPAARARSSPRSFSTSPM
jgi:hypothetical protein